MNIFVLYVLNQIFTEKNGIVLSCLTSIQES